MSAATLAAPPHRRRTLERQAMTPEQDLELLVLEQAADDTHYVSIPGAQVSLDAPAPSGEGGSIGDELVGYDPWSLVDAAIDLGLDPAEVAFSGDFVDNMPLRRGGTLVDPRKIPHGTVGGYQNHKCREKCCRDAWAKYSRDRRAKAQGQG